MHPLAVMGLLFTRLGTLLNQQATPLYSIFALLYASALALPFVAICWFIIEIAEFKSVLIGLILWACLGQYQVRQTARRICLYLTQHKKQLARDTLAPFVLRDTEILTPLGIAKATIEMLILRQAYQQIVVIFWFALTNIWVALAYRLCYELASSWNPKLLIWQRIGAWTHLFIQLMQWPAIALYTVMVAVFNPQKSILPYLLNSPRITPGTCLLTVYGKVIDAQLSGAYRYAGATVRRAKIGTKTTVKLDHIQRTLLVQILWMLAYVCLCSMITWAIFEGQS